MIRGTLRIGLTDDELEELALDESAAKVSARDLGSVAASGRSAGTTVAGSLRACRLAGPRPIRVFATGGIGGVHRGWQSRPDISGDLRAARDRARGRGGRRRRQGDPRRHRDAGGPRQPRGAGDRTHDRSDADLHRRGA